jgi:P27 family predicted phage terminase small subunit
MRGRKPKPAALKIAAGNPGKRPIVSGPKALKGRPVPPAHLTGEALAEWRRVVADLVRMGVLGRENRVSLAIYCQNWARMVEAERHVAEHGLMVAAPRTGVPMHNPYLSIAKASAATCSRIAAEFGLTPSSRQRVGAVAAKAAPATGWDALGGPAMTVIDGGKK